MAIRVILSVVGGVYLSKSKMPISSMMYEHGIWGGGRALSASNNQKIVKKIKTSNGLRVALVELLGAKTGSFSNNTMNVSFYESKNDKDLAYSIGKMNFKVSGRKLGSTWYLTLKGSDVYDFGEAFKGWSKKDLANTLGTVMQYTALLVPYDTVLNFSHSIRL